MIRQKVFFFGWLTLALHSSGIGHQVWQLGPPPNYPLMEVIPDQAKNRHYYVHWESLTSIPLYVNIDGAGDGLTWEVTHAYVMNGAARWNNVATSFMDFQDKGATTARVNAGDRLNVCVWEIGMPIGALARAWVTCDVTTQEILDVILLR